MSSTAQWKTLDHGPLEALAENLWRCEGAIPSMSLRRVMTVARRSDGDLVIHSAVAMSEAQMGELEALGRPAILLVPNGIHRLDAPQYKRRYPQLRVFTPRANRTKVEQRVPVDGCYVDVPADAAVTLRTLAGTGDQEGVMQVTSQDGVTVVLNDIMFNMDKKTDFFGWLLTTLMGSAPGPRVSRLGKLFLVKDARAVRAELGLLSELPSLQRLVVSHEKVTHGADAAAALREAMTYLA